MGFGLSGWELLVVLIVLLLLFGSRLPSIMRSLGRSATEFKRGMNEITDETLREEPKARQDEGPKKEENHSDSAPAG